MGIHASAIVEPGADVHPSAHIGPFCLIEAGAVIGAACVIESAARIHAGTRLGRGNQVGHGAALGAAPQDLGYRPESATPLVIGDSNIFREGVTIGRGIKTAAGTRVGSHNYLMAQAHIGHDCTIGDHNILANSAILSGHVELAHHCFLSGQVAVHQFCRIGAYCMIGGLSGVSQDVPPFVLANGQRARIIGINRVGLRRNGFDQARRGRINAVYRQLLRSGMRLGDALEQVALARDDEDTREILDFVRAALGGRGIIGFRRSEKEPA